MYLGYSTALLSLVAFAPCYSTVPYELLRIKETHRTGRIRQTARIRQYRRHDSALGTVSKTYTIYPEADPRGSR